MSRITRRQKRALNRKIHREGKSRNRVTSYDDLIRERDRNPRRRKTTFKRHTSHAVASAAGWSELSALGDAWRSGDHHRWEKAARRYYDKHGSIPGTYSKPPPAHLRKNPRVSFKARGRRVSFVARGRRHGPVPKHLRPYLFKSRR